MTKNELGMIQVYTGEGKGKTTAAMGLALRAVGQGNKVYIIQFLKGGAYTGEYVVLKDLKNVDIIQFGKGCVQESKQLKISRFGDFVCKKGDWVRDDAGCGDCRYCFTNDDVQEHFVRDAFSHARKIVATEEYNMVILDELNYCITANMIKLEQVIDLIKHKHPKVELVITGRNAHPEIIKLANLVSEIKPIKHYFEEGVLARRGIEY